MADDTPKESPAKVAKLYLVTRSDLRPAQQAVQAAHAMREFQDHHPEVEARWHRESNTLVFLSVPSEAEL